MEVDSLCRNSGDVLLEPPLENVCCPPEAVKETRWTFPGTFNTTDGLMLEMVHALLENRVLVSWLLPPRLAGDSAPPQPLYRSTLVCNDDGGVYLEEWISGSDLDSSALIFMCCCSLAWFGSNKDFLKSLTGTNLVKLKIKTTRDRFDLHIIKI